MPIVPLRLIGLDDPSSPGLPPERGPGVWGDIHRVEIVAVVEPKLSQRRAETGPRLSSEPDDVTDDREDAVLLQQLARLEVLTGGRALPDLTEDLVVGRFDPHQDVEDARRAIE